MPAKACTHVRLIYRHIIRAFSISRWKVCRIRTLGDIWRQTHKKVDDRYHRVYLGKVDDRYHRVYPGKG
jgi:hypothetical protein